MRREQKNFGTNYLKTLDRSRFFLSWIEHGLVSSCSIARWLKCFIEEAGIDISIFKAHSFMGASCLTAAGPGVMTKDILDAADWLVAPSSDFTIKTFREMTKIPLVLQSCHPILQTIHVNMNGSFQNTICK